MSIGLAGLPADAIRDIFDMLDDKSLLSLLHVSRVARILGLVTLLTRHKILANTDSGTKISFSSGHTGDLEKNINDISKLAVHCGGFSGLIISKAVCLSLPNLVELDLEIRYPPNTAKSSADWWLHFVYALSKRNGGIPNLLVLDDGHWGMSKRRRDPANVTTGCVHTPVFIGLPYALLGWAAWELCRFLYDPFVTRNQSDRLWRDMWTLIRPTPYQHSETLQFKFKALAPTAFPSWIHENWGLVVFDGGKMTELTIGHTPHYRLPAGGSCGPALPSTYLPQLKALQICKEVKLSMKDITPFLARHPMIESLMLNHYSLSLPHSTPDAKWPMPNLTALEAPLHYMEDILHDIDLRRLSTVCIGKRPHYRRDIIERKFDFGALDRALDTLTNSSITYLIIVLPGGLRSQKWLATGSAGTERAEARMTTVQTVTILTELDKPFHPGIALPLRDWVRLFSSIKLFQCAISRDWPSSMKTNETFGVPFRYRYDGGKHVLTENVPWKDCGSCVGSVLF